MAPARSGRSPSSGCERQKVADQARDHDWQGHELRPVLRIRGISRSFQATMKTIAPYDASAGVDSGKVTRRKAPKREQPSMRAASSSSRRA